MTRGVCGIAGRTLIINFPGNPKAIGELFGVVAPTLEHVVGRCTASVEPERPAIELRGIVRHFGERTALRGEPGGPGRRDARRARAQRRR